MTDQPAPLLLHSLSTFRELILCCLEIVQARRIVEIGSETGALTIELSDWAAERQAVVVSVDPEPAHSVVKRAAETPALELVAGVSPEALEGIQPADVYIIDGDHNHYSVSRELRHVFADPERFPLAILHDVGWPAGRRDMYYVPERLPEEAVHAYSYEKGVVPGRSELVDGGFRGEGNFAWAEHEGGERNGVLTAVEDLLAKRDDLRLVRLPAVFGVGFVWSTRAPFTSRLEALVGPLDEDPVLAALERNRLALYLQNLKLQGLVSTNPNRADPVIAHLNEEVGRLEAQNAMLRLAAERTPIGKS